MDYGALEKYFETIAYKRLSKTDTGEGSSNQQAIYGNGRLRELFGEKSKRYENVEFAYFDDEHDEPFQFCDKITWNDNRQNRPDRSPEYRLYYTSGNSVMSAAKEGDLALFVFRKDDSPLILVAEHGTTREAQLRWLFGIEDAFTSGLHDVNNLRRRIDSFAGSVMELIGVPIIPSDPTGQLLGRMVDKFGDDFPKVAEFSKYCAATLDDLDWCGSPDDALLRCYENECMLYRLFEKHIYEKTIDAAGGDYERTLQAAIVVLNRRKSRAGKAFESQIRMMLDARGVRYSYNKKLSDGSKPDFIFPSVERYNDSNYPVVNLTILEAKTTARERWTQVLKMAERIKPKHFITLEPGLSVDTTNQMKDKGVQLVTPSQRFESYSSAQRGSLMCVEQFCELVESRQS